jgi:putative FmdB family regulatory protein
MPLYDYRCSKCQQITEVRHGFDDAHTAPCPACGGALMRVFNPAPILFKGSGFYVTDSRKSSAKAADPSEAKPAPKTDTAAATPATTPAAAPAASPAPPAASGKESAA